MSNKQNPPENQASTPTPDDLFEASCIANRHARTTRFRRAVRYIAADAMEREGANIKLLWRQAMKLFDPIEPDPREGDRKPLHFDDAADIAVAFVVSGLGLDDGEAFVVSVIHEFALRLDDEAADHA